MAKYSVRKPYTVLVAVIAVIVFGITAYRNMVPDLMPNMDYPYVVVTTAYPGATPEEVETGVTRPLEQAMAVLNNIRTIQSSSSENYSLVMLEFEQDTSMDSAMVDILQAVQSVSGGWDEGIGTPSILRINPSMMPVMVASVDGEGMDRYELCQFARDTLIPELEGTTGLADVTTGGMVERTLTVTIRDDKIDETNQRVSQALEDSLAEARQELEDAQEELDSAMAQVESGLRQLENAPSGMLEGVNSGSEALEQAMAQAAAINAELSAAQARVNALEMERSLYEKQLEQLQGAIGPLEESLAAVRADRARLEPVAAGAGPDETSLTDLGLDAETLTWLQGQGCATLGDVRALDGTWAKTEEDLDASLEAARTSLAAAQATVDARLPELEKELETAQADAARLELEAAAAAAAVQQLQSGLDQMQSQILLGMGQMTAASSRLASAQAGLTASQQALDQAFTAYDQQVEAARAAADLHTVVTAETLTALLSAQNLDMPAGFVYQRGVSTIVTVGDSISTIQELEALPLFDLGIQDLEPIVLSDVAEVTASDNAGEIYATLNGNEGLLLMFSKQSNYATAQVSDNLRAAFQELESEYPGLTFTPLMDQGEYIYMIRDSILSSLLWGAVFSVLILFLFLRDWRPTVITLCSIPISLMFAIALMYFTGVSVNMMSLSGLAVSVGMLVDNSIVVIENTYRLRALGESPVKAAVSGARQVGGAVAASTLTTVCVFVPIVFVQGLTRELFTEMILTLTYALMASLVVAMTLVPAMSGQLLRRVDRGSGEKTARWMLRYRRSVRWAVEHKAAVLVTAALLLVGSGALVMVRGFTFMPDMEMDQMMVTLTMPEDASFEETTQTADEAAARMLSVEGVATVGGSAGDSTGISLSSGGGDVTFYVLLEEGTSRRAGDVAQEINRLCADLPGTVEADANSMMSTFMEAMAGSGVTVRLYGNDLNQLQAAAGQVARAMAQVEGISSTDTGEEDPSPEIHFSVDRQAAMEEGLTVAQVYAKVAEALAGSAEVMQLQDGGAEYTVVLQDGDAQDLTPKDIRNLTFEVDSRTGETHTVALRDIAQVELTQTPSTIHRLDQRRYIDVTGLLEEGYNITKTTDRVEAALGALELPEGVQMQFSGERESIQEALGQLLQLLLIGVLLVYLVMVAQFQDLKAPFIVMFTVPLAFTGGFLALLLCGMEINVLSMLGMIMLVGVIVNNGIVLVDYINQLRQGGMERREAIVEAAVTRLRPILMTSITTVLGLAVMALGQNEATSLMQPLAVTCIGGLLYATAMTLFVVPVMYDVLSRRKLHTVAGEDLELSDK